MQSDSARPGGALSGRAVHISLVLVLIITQLVFASGTASAVHADPPVAGHTGEVIETASQEVVTNFIDNEVNEVQTISNGASGGTFMLSFDGAGPTDPIRYDAGNTDVNEVQELYNNSTSGTFTITFDGQTTGAIAFDAAFAALEIELELLSNVTDVNVTGLGTSVTPWVITFVDPGGQDVAEITTLDDGMDGTSVPSTATPGNLSIETALEGLGSVADVSVGGVNPWAVTFLDPRAMDLPLMTKSDSLTGGSTNISETTKGLSAPIDPAGITYLGGNLLVSDSEINEEPNIFDGVNLWEMTTAAVVVETGVEPVTPNSKREPTGLAYNPANDHVYISNDISGGLITDVDPGPDGIYGNGDDTWTTFATGANGIGDTEDVAWDPMSQQIFVAGGVTGTMTPVGPGPNGVFDGVDDVVGPTFDLSGFVGDMEGIAYRAVSDTLLVTDVTGSEAIYEVTKDGRLIRTIDIRFTITPSDITIAPASDGTPGLDNVYLVDRGRDNNASGPPPPPWPRDGKMYELSVPFNNLAPWVDAGPNQAIAINDPLTITGDSYDDGQPTLDPLGITWTKVSGPGTVTFGSPNSLSTTVTFSTAGGSVNPYVLKLTSSDGSLSSGDIMQVEVFAGPPPSQTCPDTLSDPGFTDLAGISDEAKQAVACLFAYGITQGTSATTFSPILSVPRWQMALFLSRQASVHGLTLPAVEQYGFTDIAGLPSATRDAINQLATLGITEGTSATTFDPMADVSRWQMALFLTRTADLVGVPLASSPSSQFTDLTGLSPEAQLAINQLFDLGIAKGTSTTTFDPMSDVARWHMALFLTRLLEADGVVLE